MFAIPRSRFMEVLHHILYGDLTITETRDILRSAKDLTALYNGLIFRGSSVLKKSNLEAVIKTYPVRYSVMLMQISNSPAIFQAKHRTKVILKLLSLSKRRRLMHVSF